MANKNLKTLTLPNAQGEQITYELHPEWDNVENAPDVQLGAATGAIVLGSTNIAEGSYAIGEGSGTKALSDYTHAEGRTTLAGSRAYDIIGISGDEDENKFFIIDIAYNEFETVF